MHVNILTKTGSLMGAFIFLLIFTSAAQPSVTLEKIWKERSFSPRSVQLGRSMQDGEHYTVLENSHQINKYEYSTGNFIETLIDLEGKLSNDEGKTPRINNYLFSPDESLVLLAFDTERIYRYSSRSNYYVFDTSRQELFPLSENGKQRIPAFSPQGDQIAFVRDNNIFIKSLESGLEYAITTDGKYNHIINGTTDWVYEEEFSFIDGFRWSPDGSKIAFYRFDESHVKEFLMPVYGSLYPEEYRFKYPKAGEENAHVSIHIYNMESKETLTVDVGDELDQYIPRIRWTNSSNQLAVYRMNRHQNKLEILLANASNGQTELMYLEQNEYYIAINDDLNFLSDNNSFILSSEKDGHKHLYHYKMNGELIRQITSGSWEINNFLGLDKKNDMLYFTSYEESPLENHLYTIKLDGTDKKKLTQDPGYHVPSFSANYNYYLNRYTTINTPPVYSIHKADGTMVRMIEENLELLQVLKDHDFSDVDFITIPVSSGDELNAWILKPKDFDSTQQYPVFMYVYGGPGSQTVTQRYNALNGAWFQMLAQMGYIVVSVDNRGTGGRGEEFKKMTYLQLGKYETIDQIDAARFLAQKEYVDANNIAIFGWSYGGYLSSLCLALGADVFSAAIAVAPVTTWRFYDTIYTERYMRTPQENPDGYDDNSPINHVDKIRGAYLLVHGSADDNVHYQNAQEMAMALVEADVDFEYMVYPNHNHSIAGGNARLHLYRLMTDFLERNLKN